MPGKKRKPPRPWTHKMALAKKGRERQRIKKQVEKVLSGIVNSVVDAETAVSGAADIYTTVG